MSFFFGFVSAFPSPDHFTESEDPNTKSRIGDPESRIGDPESRFGDLESRFGDIVFCLRSRHPPRLAPSPNLPLPLRDPLLTLLLSRNALSSRASRPV